jgi:response regulator RpfG family c-di-GMP phosphodiesterase
MTARKRMLIERCQRMIAKHHETADFETKELYREVQHAVSKVGERLGLDTADAAMVVLNGICGRSVTKS